MREEDGQDHGRRGRRIALPPRYGGTTVILESREDGLSLWRVRPDARRVYIEPTTRCNLSCAICIHQVWHDTLGDMSRETFAALAKQLQAFPELRRITFGGFGEPLVHPDIVAMVAQAAEVGAGTTLVTNGLLLDRTMAEALLEARLDTVVISIDPAHVRAYECAHLAGGVARVLDNVRDFRFPSCVDCGEACAYAEHNQDCWGNAPSCADCLWAQDLVRCP